MNKMVINHLEKLFVTSDASTIITELEVQHPAAKLLVMAAQAQQQEIGDGTNLVCVGEGGGQGGGQDRVVNMGRSGRKVARRWQLEGPILRRCKRHPGAPARPPPAQPLLPPPVCLCAQVLSIAGELLGNAEVLLRDGLHPTEIADGYAKAGAKALEILDTLVLPGTGGRRFLGLEACCQANMLALGPGQGAAARAPQRRRASTAPCQPLHHLLRCRPPVPSPVPHPASRPASHPASPRLHTLCHTLRHRLLTDCRHAGCARQGAGGAAHQGLRQQQAVRV